MRRFLSLVLLCGLPALLFVPATPAAEGDDVAIESAKDGLVFKVGGAVVTKYHTAETVAKPYFWPLNVTGDVSVARAWPMKESQPDDLKDHPHQKSAWFCHGDVIPEGIELKTKVKNVTGVDFWSENPGHGKIVCVKVGEPKAEKGHAWVETHNEWRTADGVKILDEVRTLHLYAVNGGRLIVIESNLKASVCAIAFGDTKEGSMGVRVRTELNAEGKGKGTLVNSEGKAGEKEVWGRFANWCDDSGPLDGKTFGVAVLSDPSNSAKSAWHSRGYGLVAANPSGRSKAGFPDLAGNSDLLKMPKGGEAKFRFGIYLHQGAAKEGKVAETYEAFVKMRK